MGCKAGGEEVGPTDYYSSSEVTSTGCHNGQGRSGRSTALDGDPQYFTEGKNTESSFHTYMV